MPWNPLHWWDVWHDVWRSIGTTHARRASNKAKIWWEQFLKAWRTIGKMYRGRQRPPRDMPGREGFRLPDHAPLIPAALPSPPAPVIPTPLPVSSELRIDSTPIDFIARSCGKKRRYNSHEDATAVAVRCWHERRATLRVYACRVCGGWHLTQSYAEERMREGWRPPRISERQQNILRKRRRS